MPKLIIGTGLSMVYGVPGMKELSEYLHMNINELSVFCRENCVFRCLCPHFPWFPKMRMFKNSGKKYVTLSRQILQRRNLK